MIAFARQSLSLFRTRRKQLALRRAIWRRDFDEVQQFIAEGLDVNFVVAGQSHLSAALAAAERTDDRRILDFLLTHGASTAGAGISGS